MEVPDYIDPENLGERLAWHQKALQYDRMPESDLRETLRYYHASVEWGVDRQVGEILRTLEQKGITDRTIVVFTSDHGDFMGEYNMVRKGMFLYDALLHVPMIWYAPGYIRMGLSLDNMTQNVDIFPTLLDLAGLAVPDRLSGRSLKHILQGEIPVDDDFAVYASAVYGDLPENYWDDPEPYFNPDSDIPFHSRVENLTWTSQYRTAMARTRNWKLILSESHEPELYQMNGCHAEKENLYGQAQYSQVAEMLKQKIRDHWEW
jgi:arylsulfatase A-like enzyme